MSDNALHDEAKAMLKKGLLKQCTPEQRDLFVRRFSTGAKDIEQLVNNMTAGQLPWALTQLTNMLKGDDE